MKYRDLRPVPWLQSNCLTSRITSLTEFHWLLLTCMFTGIGLIIEVTLFMVMWNSLWYSWISVIMLVMVPMYGLFMYRLCLPRRMFFQNTFGGSVSKKRESMIRVSQGALLGLILGSQVFMAHMNSVSPDDGHLFVREFVLSLTILLVATLMILYPTFLYIERYIMKYPDSLCNKSQDD